MAGVGQQFHVVHFQLAENLRADAIVAQLVHRRRLAAAEAADLPRIEIGHARADEHDKSRALLADDLHRFLQHVGAAGVLPEQVGEDRGRVHPHQRRLVGIDMAFLQHDLFALGGAIVEGDRVPLAAPAAGEAGFLAALGQMVVAQAIGDQVADRADLHPVMLGKFDQVVEPRHLAVILHDLADHAGRVEPRQPRHVDRRLGMAGADQHAAVARLQREDMAGGDDIVLAAGAVDRHRHGARAVGGADPGGHALARLDRGGEGGFIGTAVVGAHHVEAQLLDPVAGHRQTDQAAAIFGHEVDRVGGRHLRRDDQVALILPVLVVDQDIHAAVARLVDDLFRRRHHAAAAANQIAFQLAQRFRGRVPVLLPQAAQAVGMQAGGAREAGAGFLAGIDQFGQLLDQDFAHGNRPFNVIWDGISHHNVTRLEKYHIDSTCCVLIVILNSFQDPVTLDPFFRFDRPRS